MKKFRYLQMNLTSFSLNIHPNNIGVLRLIPISLTENLKAELPVKKSKWMWAAVLLIHNKF